MTGTVYGEQVTVQQKCIRGGAMTGPHEQGGHHREWRSLAWGTGFPILAN